MPEIRAYDGWPNYDEYGPKYRVSFTRQQADNLMRSQLNMTIKSFTSIDTGYNNLIFLIDTQETDKQFVLKICGRYWKKIKTEIEVNALRMIQQWTTIPVPEVISYSSDATNEYGVEWILMTRCSGEVLSDVIDSGRMPFDGMKSVIRDLADFVSQMRDKIPRVDLIGTFRSNGEIGTDLNNRGPWKTYADFLLCRVRAEIPVLEENEVFQPVRVEMLSAIEKIQKLNMKDIIGPPLVFSHGDLDIQNILVSMENPESPRITAILDWEWSGSFPCSEEYFTSFQYFLGNNDERIPTYFLEQLEKRGVLTPRTIERFNILEKFNDIVTNLAPWELTDLADDSDRFVNQRLKTATLIVTSTLEKLSTDLV